LQGIPVPPLLLGSNLLNACLPRLGNLGPSGRDKADLHPEEGKELGEKFLGDIVLGGNGKTLGFDLDGDEVVLPKKL
jgi:hypothetical protein